MFNELSFQKDLVALEISPLGHFSCFLLRTALVPSPNGALNFQLNGS